MNPDQVPPADPTPAVPAAPAPEPAPVAPVSALPVSPAAQPSAVVTPLAATVTSPMARPAANVMPRAAAAPEPAISVDAPHPKPHGHGKAIAAIVTLVVLAALGGTYAWAYRGAETVLPEAARALAAADTVHVAAAFDIVADDGETTFRASLDVAGDVDTSDPENRKMQSTANVEFDGMLMSGEFRLVEDTFYARATKLPGVAFIEDPAVQAMVNQWFFVSKDEIAAVTPATIDAPSSEAISPEETLAKLLDEGAVVLGGPSVKMLDGELVREYGVEVGIEKLADLAADEITAAIEEEREELLEAAPSGDAAVGLGGDLEVAAGSDPEAFGDSLRAFARAVSFDNLKIRTTLLSGELRSIEGALVIDASRVDAAALAEASGGLATVDDVTGRARVDFSIAYTRYGEPVSIEAPTGATSILGLVDGGHGYGEDYETFGEGAAVWADEGVGDPEGDAQLVARGKAALSDARAQAEIYADGVSYRGVCESLRGGPIVAAVEAASSESSCEDGVAAWAYGAIFINGEAWCVDSTGASTRVGALPGGTSCAETATIDGVEGIGGDL